MSAPQTDIALVFPPVVMKDRYYRIARWVTVPPQGMAFLAAVARRAGYTVTVIDAVAENITPENTVERIIAANPRYVGLTGPTMVVHHAADIARRVHDRLPGAPVIMGGPHMSAAPVETLERYPEFDLGAFGEGEHTLVELVKALDDKTPLNGIQGLLWRDNGAIVKNEPRPLIDDLDTLPLPAYDLLPQLTKFYQHVVIRVDRMPSASVLISRGCAKGKCIFCSRDVYGGRVRMHSPEYCIEMFEMLIRNWGVRSINFEDEDLLAFKPKMRRLCELMLERKLDLTWAVSGRVDMVDPDLLKLMKRAGCWHISFGVESGDQEILDRIRKNITLDQVRHAVEVTKKAGITTKGFFMIGHPGETPGTIQKTIDFATSVDFDFFQVSYTVPLPGTELYRTASQWADFNADWEELNIWNPVFIPHGLTREILEKESLRMFRAFYFRPKVLWKMFLRTFRTRHVLQYLRDGFRFLGFLKSG
jgi:radical SAM superfamily enzyme YgiQ (UPF0313 family)